MHKIKFGTSGFRGIVGDDFTKQSVQKIGYAICQILKEDKKMDKPVNVGFDNRFMGIFFAKWISEVFAFYGLKVRFFKNAVSTPLIAFETKNASLGVQITASHNYYYYNGIKVFIEFGRESDAFNKRIEKIANQIEFSKIRTLDFDKAEKQKLIILTDDLKPYCNSIASFVSCENIRKKNFKVLFNAFHGSSVECIKAVCEKIGIKNYEIMKSNVDPYFDYKVAAPYVHNVSDQIEKMKANNYDIGFAFDADGDRITILDKDGEAYDCNMISAVFFYYFIKNKDIKGNFVKNSALTGLIDKISDKFGLKTYNVKNGFKFIASALIKNKNMLMGAESNGIAIKQHLAYKDGLLPAIIMLDILSRENKSIKVIINDLKREMNYPCEVLELAYPLTKKKRAEIINKVFIEKKLPLTPNEIIQVSYTNGCKMIYKNGYWGVIRFSGTENVVRIFAEMKNKEECNKYIKIYEDFIGVNQKQS
ncbi:MAG: hypothetical protein PHR96_03650 [Clostridia bacterium]|nr:hypothetical protein [Clostridia bacterium]